MTGPILKRWNFEKEVYTSPRFPDKESYERCKKFFIRQTIVATFDDPNKIIKVSVSEAKAKGNRDKLRKLELI